MVNLYTSFYKDSNLIRNAELIFCMNKNSLAGFKSVIVFVENEEVRESLYKIFKNNQVENKLIIILLPKRPTFSDFFESVAENEINVIANTDIFFENTLTIESYFNKIPHSSLSNTCLALSRWDFFPDGTSVHFERPDSQDVWIFYGKPRVGKINFGMGICGCDNSLAYHIQQTGYDITNPSKQIKSFHYHVSNVRNYIDSTGFIAERIPPPYLILPIT